MTVQPPMPPQKLASGSSPTGPLLEQLTDFFRLLSDKTRLNILLLLREGEKNVTTLCDHLGLPQPTVSHHLGLLRLSNLIENRRSGKQVFYGLSRSFLKAANDGVLNFRCDAFAVHLQPGTANGDGAQQAQ